MGFTLTRSLFFHYSQASVRMRKNHLHGLSMTLFRLRSRWFTITSRPLWSGMAIFSLIGSGCHQRAYNELYVENMASEIRLLEDRIYEYDAEYRALENELEDLRVTNEGLESRLRDAERDRTDRFSPPKSVPKTDTSKPSSPKPAPPKSSGSKSEGPTPATPKPAAPKESLKLPPSEVLEVETPAPPPFNKPSESGSGELLPPRSNTEPNDSLLPDSPTRDLPGTSGPALPGSVPPDSGNSLPLLPNPKLQDTPLSSGAQAPRAQASDRASSAPRGLPSEVARASYEERRIAAPTLPAPAIGPSTNTGSATTGSATPSDTRIRQIEFHPGLCRVIRRHGNVGEEGIALVLVPRNQKYEFVAASGKITVVLEEPGEGQARRLGKWEYTAQEAAELLEPVGSAQGIHLELPWQENKPQTNLIDVYVRFTDDQGITMVNHRQIHLRKPTPGQSTWTPK